MYAHRELEKVLNEVNESFPVITITGPRQSGKTTLVKKIYGDYPYFSFENPDIRLLFQNDPRKFLGNLTKGAIFDEFQHVPELTSYLQEIVDNNFEKVRFILTGSNQFDILNSVSQSLAGRSVILKLLPFSLSEITESSNELNTDQLIFNGFYPGIYFRNQTPLLFYRSYFETYIERDLKRLINIKDLASFQRFIRLAAGRTGQILNMNSLSVEAGVSVPTIKSWLSVLEASFIVFQLPPFYANISKRLVKSPKLYFYDTGLACYLLGIENTTQLERDPLRGALFENLVVAEYIKYRMNQGLDSNLFFYKDKSHEVDMIIKKGNLIDIAEIKSSETFHTSFNRNLLHVKKQLPDTIDKQIVIYDGLYQSFSDETSIMSYRSFIHHIRTS